MSDKEALKAEARAAKEREKERHQIDKYKSQFLDTTSNLTTRTKALIKLFEIEADEEIGVFFRDHYALVFSALSDTSNSLEMTSRKGKHVNDKDIRNTIEFIKKIVFHLQQDLQDPRNNKIVLTTLERFLYIENVHAVRLEAFRTLLFLIEVLPGNPDALKIMMSSLNLTVYISPEFAGQQFALPPSLSAPEKQLIFLPSPSGPSNLHDSMELFDELLTFAERTPEKFVFWLGIINAIIAHIFPEAAAKAGIEGANPEIGFNRGASPPDLQLLLFRHLLNKWMKDDRYLGVFCPRLSMYQLVFDFFVSAMALPLGTHLDVARLFLKEAFTFFVMQKRIPPNLNAAEFAGFQVQAFDITASIFRSGHSKDCKELVTLCRDALWLYSQCLSMYGVLAPPLRTKLLYTILAAAVNLLTIPHSNTQLVDTLKNEVLSILLNSWIANAVLDAAMWADFHRAIEPLMLHPEVVAHLRIKMMHLTLSVKEYCYTPAAGATPNAGAAGAAGAGGGSSGNNGSNGSNGGEPSGKVKKEKQVWSLDTRELVEKGVTRDTALAMIQWDRAVLLQIWNFFFCTFANVTSIKDPRTFESVARIIVDSMDLLIQTEDASVLNPSEEERSLRIPLLQTYAEILFAACLLARNAAQDATRMGGIATCYGALCRLFCRRFPKLPLRLLAQWYAALSLGLRTHQRPILCAIIDNAYNIFTYELEGAPTIIPDVVDAMKVFLATASSGSSSSSSSSGDTSSSSSSSSSSSYGGGGAVSVATKRKAVSLVASLIGLPHHFRPLALQGDGGNGNGGQYTSAQLRCDVRALLTGFASAGALDTEARIMAIWALGVLVHEDFAHFNGEAAAEVAGSLLAILGAEAGDVARATLQVLAGLSCFAARIAPQSVINDIVDAACQVVMAQKGSEAVMVEAFLCIMSWLVGANVPSTVLAERTQDKIINAIKVGKLYGCSPQETSVLSPIGASAIDAVGSSTSPNTSASPAIPSGSGSDAVAGALGGSSSSSSAAGDMGGLSGAGGNSSIGGSGYMGGLSGAGGNSGMSGDGSSSSSGIGSGSLSLTSSASGGLSGGMDMPPERPTAPSTPQSRRVSERSKTLRRLKKSVAGGSERDDDDFGGGYGHGSSNLSAYTASVGLSSSGSGVGGSSASPMPSAGSGVGAAGGSAMGAGAAGSLGGVGGSSASPMPSAAGGTGTVGTGVVISTGGISSVSGNSPRVGVRYAAEMLLECMLTLRGGFPFSEGADMMGSQIGESDDGAREGRTTSFVYNKSNIISVADIPLNASHIAHATTKEGTTAARMIIRETSGKWAWDFTPLHTPAETGLPEADLVFDGNAGGDDDDAGSGGALGASQGALQQPRKRLMREKTVFGQSFMLKQNNKLFDALSATERANPELPMMITSTQVLDKFAARVDETEALMAGLAREEGAVTTLYPAPIRECEPAPPEPAPAPTGNTTSRLLLQQLGFTSPVSALAPLVDRVQLGDKYKRANVMFDRSPMRAVHKIGLIYVSEGQETQHAILANEAGSPLYNDFVRGLGWAIDVTTHRGYLGGLDKSASAGRTAVYWADALTEVIFHEVTRMPTSETDHQQIHKKRHVGNDFVHVIWCESLRDYDPLTITSQFNEAHIVIYPQEDGLCRVQIFRDLQNNIFGPLQHGMVVAKDILPALVRETAINADNAITSRITPDPFKRPYATKKKMLAESIDRYTDSEFTYTKSVTEIIKGDSVEDPSQNASTSTGSAAPSSSTQVSDQQQ